MSDLLTEVEIKKVLGANQNLPLKVVHIAGVMDLLKAQLAKVHRPDRGKARDLQCEMAREAELFACNKCDELGLREHCSIRLNADKILALI